MPFDRVERQVELLADLAVGEPLGQHFEDLYLARAEWFDKGVGRWGALFVGSQGMLLADLFHWKLLPESKYRDHPTSKWPKRLGEEKGRYVEWDSSGHYREWIAACKTGRPTACSFDYGSRLTEMVLLANVAYRAGAKLEWDADNAMPKNCPPGAERYIRPPYRQAWVL